MHSAPAAQETPFASRKSCALVTCVTHAASSAFCVPSCTRLNRKRPTGRRSIHFLSGLFARRVPGTARGLEITIRVARIVVRIGVGIAMIKEELHRFDWNGETQAFAEGDFHVGHA